MSSPYASERKKFNRSMARLGRIILDIQRENAGAKFQGGHELYPETETLRKLGLSALSELHVPEMISIVQEACRRDTGIKHVINTVLNTVNKATPDNSQEVVDESSS